MKQKSKEKEVAARVIAASRWGGWRQWLNLLFLFLTLEIAVFSIEQARWINPQPSLTLTLFIAVLTVWLITVSRLPGWALHPIVIAAGFLVLLWQGASIMPEPGGAGRFFTLMTSWWRDAGGMENAGERVVFGTFLVLLVWLTGYLAAWLVLRRKNPWLAVALGLIIIIINLSNLPGKHYVFLTLFFAAAALLIIQTRAVSRSSAGHTAAYSGRSLFYLIVSVLIITILASSVAWAIPQLRIPALQNAIAAALPWSRDVQDSGYNIFRAIPSKKAVSATVWIQDLTFGKFWHMGNEIIYTVTSPQPAYWQVNVYDTYTSQSWISSPAPEQMVESRSEWEDIKESPGMNKIRYEVVTDINTDTLLLSGQFESAEMPVRVRLGVEEEITAVSALRILSPGEKYAMRSYVADPSVNALLTAGENYTEAVKAAYLQLPSVLPEAIRILSANVTANATTPYAMVNAIDEFLDSFAYTLEVAELPEDADAVADFLFTQKKGFCLHFASAMTVMLRSLGVPARLAVGYLPGEPGAERGQYLLRDKHYHAWTQVYFPGSGWIDFEATPSTPESQVSVITPLVSVPDIKDSSIWDVWNYPPGLLQGGPGGPAPATATPTRTYGRFSFANELSIALAVIFSIAAVTGLVLGLVRLGRAAFTRRLWRVDRERLASSVYGQLCQVAAMANLVPAASQTPLEFSASLAEVIPEYAGELDLIVQAHLAKRFGPDKGRVGLYEEAEILKARLIVYNAIIRRTGLLGRIMGKNSLR